MPKVGDETFKYNKAGMEAAKKESKETGMPMDNMKKYAVGGMVDGSMRMEKMYAGGGQTGYNKIGMYEKGGMTDKKKEYTHGGIAMSDDMMMDGGKVYSKKGKK